MKDWFKIGLVIVLFIVWLALIFAPIIGAIIYGNIFLLLVYLVWSIPIFFGTVLIFGTIGLILEDI